MAEYLTTLLSQFHLLRPWWLLALIPAGLLAWMLGRYQHHGGRWQTLIASELLPYLMDDEATPKRRRGIILVLLFWTICIIAIAGPTWGKIPVPIYKLQNPLVILLDLSPSMLAKDLKPNRISRARLKIMDLLTSRRQGTTALIVFANDAHIVVPLTDDVATILSLVPPLHPNIMPVRGSQPAIAVAKGLSIITQANYPGGDLLLITDGIVAADAKIITSLISEAGSFRLSVLALGTEEGAPIPVKAGGFEKNRRGEIILAKLKPKLLKRIASETGGQYVSFSADDSDLQKLMSVMTNPLDLETRQLQRTFDAWHDSGFWLVLLSLPFMLMAFRRNLIALLVITPAVLYSDRSTAVEWLDLWQTADQQGQRAFIAGDTITAEQQFKIPAWQGSAAYRNGNFDAAQHAYEQDSSAEGRYNLGNSLAKAGKFEDAMSSYKATLSIDPDHEDAAFNKKLIEELLKRQQSDSESSPQQQDKNSANGQQDNDQSKTAPPPAESNTTGATDQAKPDGQNHPNEGPEAAQQENAPQNARDDPSKAENQQAAVGNEQHRDADIEANIDPVESQDISDEQRQAMEQWLRKIPDDPGGLLRRKFAYEAWQKQQRGEQYLPGGEDQRW